MTLRYLFAPALLLSALATTPFESSAQTMMQDAGWLAWQGCWRAADAPAGEYLCIVPEGVGVRMVTVAGGEIRAEARVVTDGRARVVRQDGCNGTELAHWSADGRRVFLSSDLVCEEEVARKANGVFAITGPNEWLSVQSVTIADQTATRTVRYRAVEPSDVPSALATIVRNDPTARAAARRAAFAPVNGDDVGEAVAAVDASVVQEWLSAIGQLSLLGDVVAQPVEDPVVYTSALNIVNGSGNYDSPEREVVHVVEQPVTHVHHTTYVNVVRSCWDPFFSGFVFGIGRTHVGYGYSNCGNRYYSRYSPWGYDLYGWRFVSSPVVIIRSGPTFIRRPVIIRRDPYPTRRYVPSRVRDDGPAVIRRTGSVPTRSSGTRSTDNRGSVTRGPTSPRDEVTRSSSSDGRVTRSGYTNGRTTSSSSSSVNTQRTAPPPRTVTTPSRSSEPRARTTTSQPPASSPTRTIRPRSSSSSSSGTQPGSGESRTAKAKPRTTTGN